MVVLVLGGSLQVLGAETVHVVQSGETMYGIARKYNVQADEVTRLNKLGDSSKLKAGQKLLIPETVVKKDISPSWTLETLTVEKGDTLFGLAKKYAMSVDELRKINGLSKSSTLKYGQKIKVQVPLAVAVEERKAPAPVKATGDSLSPKTDPKTVPSGSILDQEKAGAKARLTEWPVQGDVYTMEGKFPGVAIKSTKGSAVHNLVGGKVIYTGSHSSLGNVVFVQGENGFMYIYGGNETVSVQNGTKVNKGDEIGKIGQSPGLTESQAYFTVWKDGAYVDPVHAPR